MIKSALYEIQKLVEKKKHPEIDLIIYGNRICDKCLI